MDWSWPWGSLGVIYKKRLSHWLTNQHRAQWRGLGDTQRQAREHILGPSLGTRAKFMTFNRIESRAVIGLLTGHKTLQRHLYLLGLHDSPLCRKCGAGEETSAHISCECESLATLTCTSGLLLLGAVLYCSTAPKTLVILRDFLYYFHLVICNILVVM